MMFKSMIVTISILTGVFYSQSLWGTEMPATKFKIHLIQGDQFGSNANSILIEGAKSILLIDTQRTVKNAESVVEATRQIGKPIVKVFITHAHPDHFLGSKVIQDAFPGAKFLATPAVVNQISSRGDIMREFVQNSLRAGTSEDAVPTNIVIPMTVKNVLMFEGSKIKIIELGEGESSASASLYMPTLQTLIAGDLVYSNVHLFLAEDHHADWQKQLNNFKKLKDIKLIYPGHGPVSDISVIGKNIRYIEDFKVAVQSSSTPTEATTKMTHLYPNYSMERFLDSSVQKFFENKKSFEAVTGGWRLEPEGRFQLGFFNSNPRSVEKNAEMWSEVRSLGLTPDGKPDVNIPVSLSLERGFTLPIKGDPKKLTYFMKFFRFPVGLNAHRSASVLINDFVLNETSLAHELESYISDPENVTIKVGEIRATTDKFDVLPFPKFYVPASASTSNIGNSPQEFIDRGLFYATLYITPSAQNESSSEEEQIFKSADGLRSLRKELVSLYRRTFQQIKSKDGITFIHVESSDGALTKQRRVTVYQLPEDIFFFVDARKRPRIQGPKNGYSSGLFLVKRIEYFARVSSEKASIQDLAEIEKKWTRGPTRIFEFGSIVKLHAGR